MRVYVSRNEVGEVHQVQRDDWGHDIPSWLYEAWDDALSVLTTLEHAMTTYPWTQE